MALTVTNAPSGNISGVGNANPGVISGVGNAPPSYQIAGPSGSSAGTFSMTPPAAPAASQNFNDPSAWYAAALKAQQEAIAPTPDFKSINANASARANQDVNPIYTKYLNDFLGHQAQQQATQTAIKEQAVQNAKDLLANTQKANEVTGQRTTADTATKEAQAAQAVDWRQTDQGGQFDIDRVAQAIQQAKSGTAGSGVGAGQQATSQTKFNTTESRQATQDAQTKAATELAKARTFEDLATSNTLATQAEGKSEKAAEFNLSSFIQQQGMELVNKQQQLEQARQQQLAQVQAQFVKSGFQDFFSKIANPAQKAAFAKAYGGYL